jgi:hypothetical protein
MSLEFYCRWGSTVEILYILKKYLKNWGSNVVGVLLSLEFYCQHAQRFTIETKQVKNGVYY